MIDFGREVCGRSGVGSRREWLITNGIGGFAMGTVAGMLTRRYHGYLVAALKPPLGRTLLCTKFDETVYYDDQYIEIFSNRWFGDEEEEPGLEEPKGYHYLERFRLVGTVPVWSYTVGDALLEKRLWMKQGENTTYVQYHLRRASAPLKLYPKAFVNYRDYHQTTIAADWEVEVEDAPNGIRIEMCEGAVPLFLLSSRGEIYPQNEWHEDFFLSVEDKRGMPDVIEDHLHVADFAVTLEPGDEVTFAVTLNPYASVNGEAEFESQMAHEQARIVEAEAVQGELSRASRHLVLAADQFIVKRATPTNAEGQSIIAGYPWFSDWGRDAMISLPGLTLCNGRYDLARSILETYAQYIDQGMLPNRFPDVGETPEYNTVDAALWFFQAVRAYMEATDDLPFLRALYPKLVDIIDWHVKGTRYSIHMDPDDGLLYAGEEGIQLTWMDVKVDDWVVTPRTGKAVEINALWYNALCSLQKFAAWLGEDSSRWIGMATRAKVGFARFWFSPENYCYDVIDGPEGHNSQLRPNQLLAVSLSHSPLEPGQQKAVLDACTRELITSHGLRSLSPKDPDYIGIYGGGRKQQDEAYHQGTVWGWLIGPFIAAHLRVYKDAALARSYLEPALRHLVDHGLGTISEIFDGDPPFSPRGCPAQAWSVAEYLRATCMIRQFENEQ